MNLPVRRFSIWLHFYGLSLLRLLRIVESALIKVVDSETCLVKEVTKEKKLQYIQPSHLVHTLRKIMERGAVIRRFQNLRVDKRDVIKDKRLCFCCLGSEHEGRSCTKASSCDINVTRETTTSYYMALYSLT